MFLPSSVMCSLKWLMFSGTREGAGELGEKKKGTEIAYRVCNMHIS